MEKIRTALRIYNQEGILALLEAFISTPTPFGVILAPITSVCRGHLIFQFRQKFISIIFPGYYDLFDKYYIVSTIYKYSLYKHRIENFKQRYLKKYEICETDTVIDVGAYMGHTTGLFASDAKKVIALEPSPRNYGLLKKNMENLNNVCIHNIAASDSTEKVQLNIEGSGRTDDDSVLLPDSGITEDSVEVQAMRIDDMVQEFDIGKINFLKVEAEGAEPEVIRGIGNLDVDHIAVNCSAERSGESPKETIMNILSEKGYNSSCENNTVYAEFRNSE